MELVWGDFGIRIPPDTAPEVTPKLLLVPLLAYDKKGYRLGSGGGFYDRYLAENKVTTVGLAFSAQEVSAFSAQKIEELPVAKHDMRLDWVITEEGAHRFPKK